MAQAQRKGDKTKATPEEKFRWGIIEKWRNDGRDRRRVYNRLMQVYRTMYHPPGDNGTGGLAFDSEVMTEVNYLYAFADTLIAQVVPPNPKVTIQANRSALKEPAKFREALCNKVFRKERLGAKLWKAATRASVWPRGHLKAVWSESRRRPIFRVVNPHYIFFDIMAEDYKDSRYICEVTVITKSDFMARMKKKGKTGGYYRTDALEDVEFGDYPDWVSPEPDTEYGPAFPEQKDLTLARAAYEWTTVYEFYDLRAKKFLHYADGVDRPLATFDLPYEHLANPYGLLVFNDNLEDLGGMSDAELVFPTIERLNEMQSLEMWHCKTAIPVTVIHEGLVDDPGAFADAYEGIDGPGQVLNLSAKAQVGIEQVLGQTPVPTLPIEWDRVTQRLERNIEFVLGLPAYARGEVGQSDVATELALTDTATRTRNARRQKEVYYLIEWAAAATLALFQQFMDENDSIPVRLGGAGENEELVTKELLQFGTRTEDPWSYDYAASPYNASEQNSVVQLKQLEAFWPMIQLFMERGVFDIVSVATKLAELLNMKDIIAKEIPPQGPMAAPPPGANPPAGPDVAQGVPPQLQGLLQGGEVEAGTGAANVPGGLEGGQDLSGALGGLAPKI